MSDRVSELEHTTLISWLIFLYFVYDSDRLNNSSLWPLERYRNIDVHKVSKNEDGSSMKNVKWRQFIGY